MLKILVKVLLGILSILAALIVIVVISIPLAGLGSTQRLAAVTNTTIAGGVDRPDVKAYVAKPYGTGPFPVVIMIHEFFGLNESIVSKAEGLADEGYLVIAPDTFRGSTTNWIPRAIYQVATSDPQQANADLDSVYAWIASQPEADASKIGIIGFCYGGRVSLLYSLHNNNIAATVVFYGSSETDPEVLKNLPGPVLGIFGGADQSIPLEEVQALENGLNAAGIQNEITVYDGQPHAFVTNMEAIRAGGVQGQAWGQMLAFLDKNLKNAPASRSGQSIVFNGGFNWRHYALLVYEHAFGTASHHGH